ncbi:hypothetical protein YC2023_072134 [Brassica napus]
MDKFTLVNSPSNLDATSEATKLCVAPESKGCGRIFHPQAKSLTIIDFTINYFLNNFYTIFLYHQLSNHLKIMQHSTG